MRSQHRVTLVIFLLLAGSCRAYSRQVETPPRRFHVGSDGSWFAERDTLLAELSRREAQWAAQRPRAYRFRTMWANMGMGFRGDVVAAPGRPLIVCDTLGVPANSSTREFLAADVPDLFQSLREALADTTRSVFVEFDPVRGFPTHLEIGNRWMTDVGYIRDVEHFRAIPEDRAHCAAIERGPVSDGYTPNPPSSLQLPGSRSSARLHGAAARLGH
jgi:hypothetical protein